ncbi:hypothetical protein [Compostibacter hankyongensis]|uniref:DUF2214 family protein n=1 Tax=Compostibacter hankyongensis TaxID=1007089 RepID=A0ABP8G6Z4_9BACT
MEQYNLYHTALAMHIIGIVVAAGTTFMDFIVFRQYWKTYITDHRENAAIGGLLNNTQRLTGIGMLLIILSGILMMAYMHGVWGEQLWFRIKMGILVLIILNALLFRRRWGLKLKKLSAAGSPAAGLAGIKNNINISQLLQLLFFIAIFVLSAFKFN